MGDALDQAIEPTEHCRKENGQFLARFSFVPSSFRLSPLLRARLALTVLHTEEINLAFTSTRFPWGKNENVVDIV